MTVMSEGLLLNSKILKWVARRRVFKLSSHSYLSDLVIVCHVSTNFVLISFVARGYPNHFDSGDRHLQLGRRK